MEKQFKSTIRQFQSDNDGEYCYTLCRTSEKPRAASASWRWRFFSLLLELILLGVAT
jgi:hypothetical protein